MKFSEMAYERPDLGLVETQFNQLLSKFDAAPTAEEQTKVLDEIKKKYD